MNLSNQPQVLDLLVSGAVALTGNADRPVIEDAVIGIQGDRQAIVASAS